MLQDYRLGFRMLLKFPGLTFAGGLALAIAIGIGAGWYDVLGKLMTPAIPLPEGSRLVLVETRNALTNLPEPRVARDFLEWRRELRTIEGLGAYRTDTRSLVVGNTVPAPIQVAEVTAAAFAAARVSPLVGRALLESDEAAGSPDVVVIGYDIWQRSFDGRRDVVGTIVKLGNAPATVIGVMPEGFAYPVNHDAWTPLSLRTSYQALEGGPLFVIGRLASGISVEQANAEMRVFGERTAASLPTTHAHLRPAVRRLGEAPDVPGIAQFALRNVPVLLVLTIACLSVGTLVYARTATREGEIAVRSALGATRWRIVSQLFVETFVLASIAAAVGLMAADQVLRWAIKSITDIGGAPFWLTPGLQLSTVVYALALAVVSAGMLSILPALKATRVRLQPQLANLGSGGATLRFGRVWTSAMIIQVGLTAIGIPIAMETASQAMNKVNIRAEFPSRDYVAAYIDLDRTFDEESTSIFEERRALTMAALERRIAEEPGVAAVTFAERAPGELAASRVGAVESATTSEPLYTGGFRVLPVGRGFFEAFDRPMVAGRAFHGGDWSPTARTVIVNEAFAREFARDAGGGSPIGARVRYRAQSADADSDELPEVMRGAPPADEPFEIVGVVRDLGLDPDDSGKELPCVFHPAMAATAYPFVLIARVHGNPDPLAARLPVIAAGVDASFFVRQAQSLDGWIRQRDESLMMQAAALAAVTVLALFLSALGIFSLVSVSVSRRTREIGLRTALGATTRQVLAGIVSRGLTLMGGGIAAGGALLMLALALGMGPSGQPMADMVLFAVYLGITSTVMLAASVLACIAPARRALRINPTEALRDA